jgi:hypothetical protein
MKCNDFLLQISIPAAHLTKSTQALQNACKLGHRNCIFDASLVSEQLMLHMNNQAHKKAAGGSMQETKNMLI